ncbi:hypothetical protein [Taylorella asinigenitalis]|uniref:hypothetical protein n=1 Tax=Taylorella asinigenitalis TaxID=84590 RepID=UPI0005D282B7|nr:hypothetical protein [Taylorella asinigenitalis]
MTKTPKSYLTEEERQNYLKQDPRGKILNLSESFEACMAGDIDSAWLWLARVDLCENTKRNLRNSMPKELIDEYGLKVD